MIYIYSSGGGNTRRLIKLGNSMYGEGTFEVGLSPKKGDFIINWGQLSPFSRVLNACPKGRNKKHHMECFDRHGLNIPKIWNRIEDIPDEEFPVLGRRYYHRGGKDIVYYRNRDDYNTWRCPGQRPDFYVKFIDKVVEYRVHVLPPLTFLTKKLGAPHIVVWNLKNVTFLDQGSEDHTVNFTEPKLLRVVGESAVISLGLDFGAVDIIEDKNGILYVLEVNTSPGLKGLNGRRYINYFMGEYEKSR